MVNEKSKIRYIRSENTKAKIAHLKKDENLGFEFNKKAKKQTKPNQNKIQELLLGL